MSTSEKYNLIDQSYDLFNAELYAWLDQLSEQGLAKGITKKVINLNQLFESPAKGMYQFLTFAIPQVPNRNEDKIKILQKPHLYFKSVQQTIKYIEQNAKSFATHPSDNLKKAMINIGIALSCDAIVAATLQHYSTSMGGATLSCDYRTQLMK
ncbi:hypothetical protein A2642_03030 [Candidatus Nomurabacteria bacterium RIFCSPHIGHO2_01_FULL_39_10]|uniref:Uncharacterized protein n=1 Tax=Candidatus Nomurabacteria bacterium RIFCSPHIGHO2_01_FULL_39_10 TaxID=1801733 RepID=A0A1F6V6P4_9BACT|nr:MAG: hypothetical protein A2642_03030 [Candidatus Nomurabacteria bacterium RIFCSPHIGHO2_01_FULL_39_10]